MNQLRPALVLTAFLLVLCCGVYPAIVTVGGQWLFHDAASGSLIVRSGHVVGSSLIGQSIADREAHPEYLWGRPSAASNDKDTGITSSSGSNYGPSSETLKEEVQGRITLLEKTGVRRPVPIDLVTKSASGLDPHLSPQAAELQLPRVATARNLPPDVVTAIVRAHTEQSSLGFLGEPRVNVLLVNFDLDDRAPKSAER